MAPSIVVIPSSNAVVHGTRISVTPDHVLGRSEAARATLSLAVAPLGPLVAGAALGAFSARVAVGVFVASSLVLAVWATVSRSLDPDGLAAFGREDGSRVERR